MSFRFSRRNALSALSAVTAFPGALTLGGCSGAEGEEEEEVDEGALGAKELLGQYKKLVVLVMENRSFDHYFGHLSLPRSEGGEGRTDVNGFKSLAAHSNPDLNGNRIGIHRTENFAIGDIDHEWVACHEQFNGDSRVARAKNEGFITAHQKDLERLNDNDETTKALCYGQKEDLSLPSRCGELKDPMAFYTRKDTPIFHELADEYTLCDNWFASVMGPTWPNRFYLLAGTSDQIKDNSSIYGLKKTGRDSIFGQFTAKMRDLKKQFPNVDPDRQCVNFFSDVPLAPIMFPTAAGNFNGLDAVNFLPNYNYAHVFDQARSDGLESLEKFSGGIFRTQVPQALFEVVAEARKRPTFQQLAKSQQLPLLSYIEPPFQLAPADDHPPHDILVGQAFVSSIYKILQDSEEFQRGEVLFIITYDEHGSFYDHVAPPQNNREAAPEFRQLGFRVPALVIGKNVKKKFVSKKQYEHTSVLATATNRFGLTPANDRVRTSNDISDCIEGGSGNKASGQLRLKKVEISEARALETAEMAPGQKEIVDRVFGGHVPYEAKRVYTQGLFEIFDKLGVASIRK